jgi:hypothetical protein
LKKPIHKFAIILWAAAVLFAVSDLMSFNYARHLPRGDSFSDYLEPILVFGRGMLVTCGILAGLGFIVELLDQIRWHLSQRGP